MFYSVSVCFSPSSLSSSSSYSSSSYSSSSSDCFVLSLSDKKVMAFDEGNGDENWDDEWETCLDCGGSDFIANEKEWERVCTSCGMTSAYELFNYVKIPAAYYYKHENYFQNTIIANAVGKGAPISHIQEHLMLMFHKSLGLFHRMKRTMNRNNYPNYQYALLKLCEHLKVDVKAFIKLPKMKKTLKGVEEDWILIDPCRND